MLGAIPPLSKHLHVVVLLYTSHCDRMIGVRFPAGAGNFSLRHRVQTGSGVQPASYPMGIGGSFPEGKAAGG
jgi:hypothetical protein